MSIRLDMDEVTRKEKTTYPHSGFVSWGMPVRYQRLVDGALSRSGGLTPTTRLDRVYVTVSRLRLSRVIGGFSAQICKLEGLEQNFTYRKGGDD